MAYHSNRNLGFMYVTFYNLLFRGTTKVDLTFPSQTTFIFNTNPFFKSDCIQGSPLNFDNNSLTIVSEYKTYTELKGFINLSDKLFDVFTSMDLVETLQNSIFLCLTATQGRTKQCAHTSKTQKNYKISPALLNAPTSEILPVGPKMA